MFPQQLQMAQNLSRIGWSPFLQASAVPGPSEAVSMATWLEAVNGIRAARRALVSDGQRYGWDNGLRFASDGTVLKPLQSTKYQCGQCGDNQFERDVYINIKDPSMDWQGSLNLICRECWNAHQVDYRNQWNRVDWHKACIEQWLQRELMSREHYEHRVSCCRRARKHIHVHGEIENRWMYRENLSQAIGSKASSEKLMSAQQNEMLEAFEEWRDQWIQKTQDRSHVTDMDVEECISTPFMELVDKVLPGVDEYYICRQKSCSMVCLSTHWVNNYPSGQYRCPACGEMYRPWNSRPSQWKTNKVYIAYDEVGLQVGKAELAAGSSEVLDHRNLVRIFPVMWPDTSTQVMIDRIKAIFLNIEQELIALPSKERLEVVLQNLSVTPPHKAFETHQFLPETKAHIDHLNAVQSYKKLPWKYDHIENGYMGIKLGPEHNLDQPLEQVDLLRVWGLAVCLADKGIQGISVSLT
jgi:predicted RNA-binding Zn-ribbon protein involved in translation (DUF1610 family)